MDHFTILSFDQWVATIEKPLGAIVVAPKTIVKPLGPMVGGAIEKPFHHGFSTMESKIIENH